MRRCEMPRVTSIVLGVLLLSCVHLSLADSTESRWREGDYDLYDAEEFLEYAPAGERIDMNRIDYPLLNAAIFFETNRMRSAHGRTPFIHSHALEEAAFGHSRDMVEEGFFSHTNPRDRAKRTMSKRLALVGVTGGIRAENIAIEFGIQYVGGTSLYPPKDGSKLFREAGTGEIIENHTYLSFARAVVDGWMHSSGHRANILNPALNFLGCGAFHFEDRSFYGMDKFKVTQNFASAVDEAN
jgi:uncharacterized protein YkwD